MHEPEVRLWKAVVLTALDDMFRGRGIDAQQARDFLSGRSRWFYHVCDMAEIDGAWIKRKINELLESPDRIRLISAIRAPNQRKK